MVRVQSRSSLATHHTHAPQVTASALELYNEDLLDLSQSCGREKLDKNGWDMVRASLGLKLQERPVGKDGRVVPEVRAGGRVWAFGHVCACVFVVACVCMCVWLRVYMHACVFACLCACACACLSLRLHAPL